MKCNILLKVVVTLSPMTNHKRSDVRNGINSLMTSIFIMKNDGGIVIISIKGSFAQSDLLALESALLVPNHS